MLCFHLSGELEGKPGPAASEGHAHLRPGLSRALGCGFRFSQLTQTPVWYIDLLAEFMTLTNWGMDSYKSRQGPPAHPKIPLWEKKKNSDFLLLFTCILLTAAFRPP